ncbi:MAG TPA: tetratricopeptide repeat protein, partial [Candidatus Acidoferrales bacterium]|nr:tetratricopeptide repeat protein [Candidatus Acidoferrales bacterium]
MIRSRPLVLLAACALAHLAVTDVRAAAAAHAAAPVALPDTGLFAPVAKQYRGRLERLHALPAGEVTAERLDLLLATGQPDEAARIVPQLPAGHPRRTDWWTARVMLARQDFSGVPAIVEHILALGDRATPLERTLPYRWFVACDDGARLDTLTRAAIARAAADPGVVPELIAAGKLAYDRLDYARADSLFSRASSATPLNDGPSESFALAARQRSLALTGLALVQQKRREWDRSLVTLREALEADGSDEVLMALTETLIRLGRTDEAISAAEWAVRLAPYDDAAHYLLGNGYARKNYTQLFAAYRAAFADEAGRARIEAADRLLGDGQRDAARGAYAAIVAAHPGWADARVRLASLDFEDGRFEASRDGCFEALRACPEYGRAHAVLAKALEGQRFVVDVHRAGYEARFAAAPMPEIPGIEKFVVNWRALSPRHQKRVALSMAPWKAFIPVLVEGGATYYIKPVYMLLSECPAQRTLRDQRISYDSRLWDDVRGCGGYHTVTGIEDVERTIFDRYNTVLHEFTHQVHAVLTADDSRAIQEHYRAAKARDDRTQDGFLSRYAGGSVFEYFAEGANALESPMRDAYDPREIVRERLDRIDPDLRTLVEGFMARTDVSASYPIAYAAGGDDAVERGRIEEALPLYRKALAREPDNETALVSLARAYELGERAAQAESVATLAVAAHPASGPARVALADARWHAGRALAAVRDSLAASRPLVRAEDRYQVDVELGVLAWTAG